MIQTLGGTRLIGFGSATNQSASAPGLPSEPEGNFAALVPLPGAADALESRLEPGKGRTASSLSAPEDDREAPQFPVSRATF
jgi:hypothetical protein